SCPPRSDRARRTHPRRSRPGPHRRPRGSCRSPSSTLLPRSRRPCSEFRSIRTCSASTIGSMSKKRVFDDPCGIARALNAVGERWALLVVRELVFGPKRYSDLHRGLPQMSQNVLAQRLRELEADGLVQRRRLGPPAPVAVYELTERGQELEPVLLALAHWGSRAPGPEDRATELSVDALLFALRATFDPELAGELSLRCQLDVAGDRFRVTLAGGRLEVARGE